jgi:hypothetical protein
MKKNYLVNGMAALALLGGLMLGQAQNVRRCATMENLERLKQLDPDLEARMEDMEKQTQEVLSNMATQKGGLSSVTATIYQIPVVVHVVYNTTAQNLSDAQIQTQIDVLNEDFRRMNADKSNTPAGFASLAADCEIQFCLASVAPNGAATTGIVRKYTSTTSWSQDDAVKYSSSGGDDAWPATKYLNLWVCNLGGGLLGYAQFPGGPAATDGVVINYQYFGRGGSAAAPYNKGRTGTHEVGHWLNLYHIWGDDNGACTGSDQVSDTPNQGAEHYGCPAFPSASCSNGSNGDMFMNYMDYTDDGCMNMFTLGQKSRMRALFATGGAKESLLTSNGCGGTVTPSYCAANGNSVQYEWINNVTLGSINNTTAGSAGGYGNYTSLTATVAKGSAYTLSLKPGFAGTTYTEYFKVYIDYNNDKDFADAGENVYTSAGTTAAVSGSITIPSTAVSGTTRMRVMMSDGAISSSCGSMNYGEVEDYSINITAGTTSSCGTPSGLSASSVTASSATLSWSSVLGASSYNVRYKATSSTTWITASSTSNSKAIAGLTAGTQYEFQVQAVCSAAGNYSASAYLKTAASSVTSAYVTVGNGTSTTGASPYSSYYMDERTQFIITQSELAAAGWTSANSWLRSLAFYATSTSGQALNGFTIKIANTSATSFASTSFLSGTFTTVYSGNVTVSANTWNTYNFTTAFNYSGTGNLLVEICWNNSSYTSNCSVQYTSTSAYRTLYYRADVASGGVCANATGSRTYARPNMRMLFKNSATGKMHDEEEENASTLSALSEPRLYPNPAGEQVNVEFSLPDAAPVSIRLVDMLGRVMLQASVNGQAGTNLVNLNTTVLEQGNYIVVIGEAGDSPKMRLLISK